MSHPSILLIENDASLRKSLVTLFDQQQWRTQVAGTLAETWELLDRHQFNLAVIDRVLNDGDGLEIIKYLREIKHPMMLLCLTEKGQVMERLKGLEAGADDYLPKPFSAQELVLRMKSLLSKSKVFSRPYLVCDSLSLDPETGYFVAPSKNYYLKRRENQILTCLFRHQKAVVTRQMLLDALWPGAVTMPEDSTIDVYVRRLRMGLGEYGKVIKTVRGFGYMLKP